MVSKYDLHWNRVKPGLYRLSNGNYEVIKKGNKWEAYWYDGWNGKKVLIHITNTCADCKSYVLKYHDKKQKEAIKKLGRKGI